MKFLLYIPLLLAITWPVQADVRIPVQQCHLWAMNAVQIIQYKNKGLPEKDMHTFFNEMVVAQGGNPKTDEAEAVRELIRKVYRGKEKEPEVVYDKYMKECVVNEGLVLRKGQARS